VTRVWPVVVVAGAMTWGPSGPPGAAVPTVLKAEPAPEWNAKFAGKEGWIGGDVVCSAVVGPKRVVWLFGDTLLGSVKDGQRRGAVMVNNTVGIQDGRGKGATIRFVSGKSKDGKPAAVLLPADGKGWFWPQHAVEVDSRLFVFLPQVDRTKDPGVLGFKIIGQWLAIVENPQDDPEQWRVKQQPVPFADFQPDHARSWGSAVLAADDYLYVYGFHEQGKKLGQRRLTVARVPAKKLDDFAAWQFRTQTGWSAKAMDAAPLADGLATEFSVSTAPGGKGYVAVYTENGLGDRIVGRFASAPEGPWSAPLLLYTCPEMGKDKGVFSYAGKAHPWAASGSELLVSYCVNTWEFAALFRDETVYRPKFVRIQLHH
jgi:hypothetical protein